MKDKLAFVGCGLIGAGLAANSLLTGHPTALYDTCDTAIIKERITAILNTFVTHGAYTQEQADEAYTSHNTNRLDVDGVVEKIMTTDYVKEELKGRPHAVEV